MKHRLVLGCVADDFTGASDAASFLMEQGLKTVLFNGIPKGEVPECSAVVIALKSRTQKTSDAVKDSMKAFMWLHDNGAEHLFFKYCSTFDSTKDGNIGPVLDALLEKTRTKYSILSPALPVNGRTVKNGILYVDGVPLSETHMKNHPLTPMWASSIQELMSPQCKYETLNLNFETLEKTKEDILDLVSEFAQGKDHFYIIPDYLNDFHGAKVADVFSECRVLSGGSGILAPLAKKYSQELNHCNINVMKPSTQGKALVLAGSCSKVTLAQITNFQSKGYASYRIDPIKLSNGIETVEDIWKFATQNTSNEILIYSSDNVENVEKNQKLGKGSVAEILEQTIATLAQKAVNEGYTRIIIAGGETSSAACKKLGYHSFEIGESVAPGVPVMAPLSDFNIRIVLKSGNFGQVDFFERALNMTKTSKKDV